jgi:ABC-type lipoprotein export system ATPase subunit
MKTLELKNICKSFKDVSILVNANISLAKGERMCLFGASGSGKSSLLYIASGILKQDEGDVFVMGEKMQTEEDFLKARRQYFGFIFQFHNLIPELTVSENIFINQKICEKEDKKFADFLLNELGLFEKRDAKPQTLSGGEAQRVAVVRAFASKPAIVFADEPTGSLDPETGEKTITLILNLAKQQETSILAVSHNQSFKEKFDTSLEIANKALHLL